MIERDADRIRVRGEMTLTTVPALLPLGAAQLESGAGIVDLSGVTAVDSSAVALLLEWTRVAQRRGGSIAFHHPGENLISLVKLYDVSALLPFPR